MQLLHPLLGTDKSNPFLELLIDPTSPSDILVHFGMRLLEKVTRGKDRIEEKMLAGRLYNANFKRSALVETFNKDRKTLQRYGNALKSGDVKKMTCAFSGQGGEKKLDKHKELFVRQTFRDIYCQQGCHSNRFIRKELKRKLGITVNRETVRLIINEEKEKMQHSGSFLPVKKEDFQEVFSVVNHFFAAFNAKNQKPEKDTQCNNGPLSGGGSRKICNHSPCFPPFQLLPDKKKWPFQEGTFLHHAGLFLARPLIDRTSIAYEDDQNIARQWIGSVLCGAVNLEQMRQLNYPALELLIGPQISSNYRQRKRLHQVANSENTTAIWRENIRLVEAHRDDTFLYDPHGIEYTGEQKILKGWLGGSHKIAKAYYQDFVHTTDGKPVMAFLEDNYEDLRLRFPRQVPRLRQLLGGDQDRKLTFVIDRAIYDLEELRNFRDQNVYVITWEKAVKNLLWEPPDEESIGRFAMIKYKNSKESTTTYHVQYYRQPWSRETSFWRYVVALRKGDEAAPIILPVLCTDPTRNQESSIRPILERWVQENDLLYNILNVGINEITSYKNISYAEIADSLTDHEMGNPVARKLCAERLQLKRLWGKILVCREEKQKQMQQFLEEFDQSFTKIQSDAKKNSDPTKQKELKKKSKQQLLKKKKKQKTYENFKFKNRQDEADVVEKIRILDKSLEKEPLEISRLERLIEENFRKLNFDPKAYMDAIRITARNIFGVLHSQFRPVYNNYRNDHRILRELIRAPGVIRRTETEIIVTLIPSRQYSKKTKNAVEQFLQNNIAKIDYQRKVKTIRFRLDYQKK